MTDELPTPESQPPEGSAPGESPSEPPSNPEPTENGAPKTGNKRWYVVKVQSGREESIKESIERRVKIEGLDDYFGQIIIPIERVTQLNKSGKRVVKEQKLYPGYLMVNLEFTD